MKCHCVSRLGVVLKMGSRLSSADLLIGRVGMDENQVAVGCMFLVCVFDRGRNLSMFLHVFRARQRNRARCHKLVSVRTLQSCFGKALTLFVTFECIRQALETVRNLVSLS